MVDLKERYLYRITYQVNDGRIFYYVGKRTVPRFGTIIKDKYFGSPSSKWIKNGLANGYLKVINKEILVNNFYNCDELAKAETNLIKFFDAVNSKIYKNKSYGGSKFMSGIPVPKTTVEKRRITQLLELANRSETKKLKIKQNIIKALSEKTIEENILKTQKFKQTIANKSYSERKETARRNAISRGLIDFDTIYLFYNSDLKIHALCTRYDLCRKFNLSMSQMLEVTNRVRKHRYNWSLAQ